MSGISGSLLEGVGGSVTLCLLRYLSLPSSCATQTFTCVWRSRKQYLTGVVSPFELNFVPLPGYSGILWLK